MSQVGGDLRCVGIQIQIPDSRFIQSRVLREWLSTRPPCQHSLEGSTVRTTPSSDSPFSEGSHLARAASHPPAASPVREPNPKIKPKNK